jgi:AcrR family transcriptional regulator
MPAKGRSAQTTSGAGEPEPRRPSLREAQREFTRRLLMEVAVEVFERNGYANTTIDDIVTAANATRATFYQYFSSKREIVAALVDEMGAKGAEMFEAFTSVEPPTRQSVRVWLESIADFYREFRTVMGATMPAAAQDSELAQRVVEVQARFISSLAGRLPPDARHSSLVRATLLEAQRDRIMEWWIINGRDVGGDEVLDALTDIWSAALGIGE